ncbi:MAG: N-acetylmuramoyl-L-alanine amidase [Actinomycetota bacterium]|nr:N-acetylmuramoyl-L-alanine amidase [Actinomycetota bacterium]
MTNIDESQTAKGFTPSASVPQVFGAPRTIEGIVIHHWGLTGQSHDGVVNFFVNGPGATSAHFVVSGGRITCLVSPADAAWHCPGKNASTIGIECRPEATDEDYATVAELVATLRSQHGNLPLSMHRDWYSTACPGVWDLSRIDALASGSTISAQSSSITPTTLEGFLMALSDQDQDNIYQAITRIDAWIKEDKAAELVNPVIKGILFENRVDGRNIVDTGRQGLANDAAILASLSGLKAGTSITAADIAAAIPADIAKQVADLLAKRLAA